MLSVVSVGVSVPSGLPLGVTALTLCVSLRSTSVKAIVPLLVSVANATGVPVVSVTAPVTSATSTTGASFTPVTVTTTFCVTTPAWPSLMLTV